MKIVLKALQLQKLSKDSSLKSSWAIYRQKTVFTGSLQNLLLILLPLMTAPNIKSSRILTEKNTLFV